MPHTCNVCGRNLITGLTSAATPRVDISSTCKVGLKFGVSLPLSTCYSSMWPSWLLYRRDRKSRRDLWITLYIYDFLKRKSVQVRTKPWKHVCGSRDPYILNLGHEQSTSALLQWTEPLAQIGQQRELWACTTVQQFIYNKQYNFYIPIHTHTKKKNNMKQGLILFNYK